MTADDVLAYLASQPKSKRPTELRSDATMLRAWLLMRDDEAFWLDVIFRHCLTTQSSFDPSDSMDEHAISNAWGHCVQAVLEHRKANA